MALISVIVPVYKVESYLLQCVNSVLTQTFSDFELILVDDGSPDNCPVICDDLEEIDERVKVIHKENGGLSSARNAGLDYVFEFSESNYISFLDSDDYIDKSYLEKMLETMIQNNCDVVMSNVKELNDRLEKVYDEELFTDDTFDSIEIFEKCKENLGAYYTTAWGKLYKKDLLRKIRFKLNVIYEDEYFSNLLYSKKLKVSTIKEYLYFYVKRKGSITSNIYDYFRKECQFYAFRERYKICRKLKIKRGIEDLYFCCSIVKSIKKDEILRNKRSFNKMVVSLIMLRPTRTLIANNVRLIRHIFRVLLN